MLLPVHALRIALLTSIPGFASAAMSPNPPRAAQELGRKLVAQEQETSIVPLTPRVIWHVADYWSQQPVISRELLYLAGPQLTARDLDTGAAEFTAPLAGPWQTPIVKDDVVVALHEDGTIHAFSADLQRELWQAPAPDTRGFPGTLAGDVLLIGDGAGVLCLALADGARLWRAELPGRVSLDPACDGERVYAATENGTVVALALATGEPLWKREFDTKFGWSDPVLDDGLLFIADRGVGGGQRREDRGKRTDEVQGIRAGALHAFATASGEHLWGRIFGATGFSRPFVDGDSVWAGFGSVVARFDRKTGEIDFEHAIPTGTNAFGSPTVLGDAIVFGNLDGHLYVHDVATRELRWVFEPGGKGTQVGAFTSHPGRRLFVSTTCGVFALGDTPGAEPVLPGFVLRPRN